MLNRIHIKLIEIKCRKNIYNPILPINILFSLSITKSKYDQIENISIKNKQVDHVHDEINILCNMDNPLLVKCDGYA